MRNGVKYAKLAYDANTTPNMQPTDKETLNLGSNTKFDATCM